MSELSLVISTGFHLRVKISYSVVIRKYNMLVVLQRKLQICVCFLTLNKQHNKRKWGKNEQEDYIQVMTVRNSHFTS